ncbi:MAG: LysR family transcriptional regulator [Opitutaceae bacterium]|jgi:DNA-binding transcriptional LysR family regulator|nr:LysR family transcriptional regulator [Opitutaceae bacterium]
MELRHLRYFVAVAEELNFRRAAERLHVSAPTLSVQIRDLESHIDTRLLERDTTRVRLTVAGEVFLREARRLLEQLQQMVTAAREAGQGRQGRLRIGNAGAISYGFLPTCLNLFRERFPDVDVTLEELAFAEQHTTALRDGRIQIGFIFNPEEPRLVGLNHLQIVDTPFKVLVSDAHPFARRRRVSLRELEGEPLLAVGPPGSTGHAEHILALLRDRMIRPGPMKAVMSQEAFLAMVAGGQGVSLVPMARSISRDGLSTVAFRENGPDLQFRLHAIWKADESSPLVKNFVEVLRHFRSHHA